jgi:hypothetical protein
MDGSRIKKHYLHKGGQLLTRIVYGHNFERRDKSALPTPEITVLTSGGHTNSSQDLAIESCVELLGTSISHWRASLSCEG